MDQNEPNYDTVIYNPGKAFLYAFAIYIVLTALIIEAAIRLNIPEVGVVGWILISSVPFAFRKSFRDLFIKNVELNFTEERVSINILNSNTGALEKKTLFKWSEIASYQCSFTSKMTYLTLTSRNGDVNKFSFQDEMDEAQACAQQSAFSLFHYYICQYNEQNPGSKILLKAGFLTTRAGLFIILIVMTMAIAAIVIHIIVAPHTAMLSFMSLSIIICLLGKRAGDKNRYKRISRLSPHAQ